MDMLTGNCSFEERPDDKEGSLRNKVSHIKVADWVLKRSTVRKC